MSNLRLPVIGMSAFLCAVWLQPDVCYGDRDTLQKNFLHQQQNNPSPFGSAPISHIIPRRDTITLGLSVDYYDITVAPEDQNIADDRSDIPERLDVVGTSASPLVAFSKRNVAIALTAEGGVRSTKYVNQPGGSGANFFQEDRSELTYTGGGAFLYFIPKGKLLPRAVKATVLGGISKLKVKHANNGTRSDEFSKELLRTYEYAVTRNNAGANVNIRIGRKFNVIIWFNYVTHSIGDLEVAEYEEGYTETTTNNSYVAVQDPYGSLLEKDQELVWKSGPRQRLGIDLALTFSRLEIHFGGLLGLIGALGTTPDYIHDKSIFASFAFSFRDR